MMRSVCFVRPRPFLQGQLKGSGWRHSRPVHRQSVQLRAQQQDHHSGNGASDNGGADGYTLGAPSSAAGWLEGEGAVAHNYDAIMVLGGGLTASGGVPAWVQRRLDGSLHIWQQQSKPCSIVLLGAGTPHKPPVLGKHNFVVHEASVYADYLMGKGVGAAQLLKETQSYDTVGNGYFSLMVHALPAGWRKIAVVTSAFHMPRTRATFDYCYSLAGRQFLGSPAHFQLSYHSVSDAGLFDPAVIEARAVKEAAAVETWRRNTAPLDTMHKFHEWLFATHLCYSVGRQGEWGGELDQDPRLAATY